MHSAFARFWFPISIIALLVLSFLSNDLFIPSMPALMTDFHASANGVQNAVTAWFIGSMSLQVVLGPISDQYGRKPILLFSALILMAASLLCGLSHSLFIFLLGRLLQGVGVSGIMVTAFAALHEVYEKENNGTKILGYVGLCTALSPLAGPLVGGYIAAFFGWQANFYVMLMVGLPLIALLAKYMPETVTAQRGRIEWKKISQDYAGLFKNWTFVTTISCYGFLFLTGGAFLAVVPFIFVDLLGLPVESVGYGMMPMFICYMAASGLAGKLEKRVSAKKIIGISLGVLSLWMVFFIAGSGQQNNHALFILSAISAYYIGLGLIGPPLNHISLSQATSENKGCASALLTVTMMLGSACGAGLMSYCYNEQLLSIALVMGGGIIAALIAFVLYLKHTLTISARVPF